MQLTAIGLATMLASVTAFAVSGGNALAGGGAGWTYTNNPAECGGLVCFAKSPAASATLHPRRKRLHRLMTPPRGAR
jgi:hypothetical protein